MSTKTRRDSAGGTVRLGPGSSPTSDGGSVATGATEGVGCAAPSMSMVIVTLPLPTPSTLSWGPSFAGTASSCISMRVPRARTGRTGIRPLTLLRDGARFRAERGRSGDDPDFSKGTKGFTPSGGGSGMVGFLGTGGASTGTAPASTSADPEMRPKVSSAINRLRCLMIATLTCGIVKPLTSTSP